MALNYASLEKVAQRLIRENGKDATLVKSEADSSSGPWDPSSPTETESTIKVVETGYSIVRRAETTVQAGDKIFIVSTSGESPEIQDSIKLGGVSYVCVEVEPVNPGGTTVYFDVLCRA
ncbi:MAG: hypothetical protein GVY36_18835 [Verrucomicrobia bacterium]|jgi:hypothetical protein|nr:hypothetical protein [Verrucomicrobiota bacterium]